MYVSFPTSLALEPLEKKIVEDWAKKFPPKNEEMDCCMSSDFTFSVFSSGLGDCKSVKYGRHILHFYIDDGSPFCREELLSKEN